MGTEIPLEAQVKYLASKLASLKARHRLQQRAAKREAEWRSRVVLEWGDEDDELRRVHRGCGAFVRCFILRRDGEVMRCLAGHQISPGSCDVVRVRKPHRRPLAVADVSDVLVEEVIA